MAKGKKIDETPVVENTTIDIMVADPASLTREQLKARYEANVAERTRLAEENKVLGTLYKGAVSTEKKSAAEQKIAALQAKLAALRNPTPAVETPVADEAPAAESVAI
jgi:hypothetical protein